jgi:DNA repair ATPase RecN
MNENAPVANAKKYKITIGILSAIIVVLSVLLIITKTKVNTFIIEKEKAVTETQNLQKELDSLLTEHEKIKAEYGNMTHELTRKDSIIQANADEIQKLIASNAGKHQIQRKLDYLRGITQDYVAQIDKLVTENNNLKTEIAGITEDYNKEKEHAAILTKDKENLSEQINKAAVLSANNITATAIRLKSGNKEEVVDKAIKTDKIKITFTMGKNPLVKDGMKEVYVRIARPDNAILQDGSSFEYNGQQIMYSLKQSFNYQQKSVPITLYYEKSDRIIAGTYHIAIFIDGQEIGQTQLALK